MTTMVAPPCSACGGRGGFDIFQLANLMSTGTTGELQHIWVPCGLCNKGTAPTSPEEKP